jgi:hypothetical protein
LCSTCPRSTEANRGGGPWDCFNCQQIISRCQFLNNHETRHQQFKLTIEKFGIQLASRRAKANSNLSRYCGIKYKDSCQKKAQSMKGNRGVDLYGMTPSILPQAGRKFRTRGRMAEWQVRGLEPHSYSFCCTLFLT